MAVMKWKKKDEEEMRLKEEEYMNSRRVSQANINRTKGKSRRGSTVPENFKKKLSSTSANSAMKNQKLWPHLRQNRT